jgi:hypothetical protein
MASISQLTARLVDLFGSPATANPAKLLGNLGVSSNGNVLVGTSTDDATNKLQVTGPTKITGALTTTGLNTVGGSIVSSASPIANFGVLRTTFDLGGSFVDWNNQANRGYPIQVDAPAFTAAYGGIRWTRWGGRHLAAIDAYEGGSGSTQPSIVMHVANQTSAWTFGNTDINRGAGGYVIHTANMAASCVAYSANRLRLGTGGGGDTAWNWAGQGGQPPWVWGGSDGANMYVYNPSNFSVNYANSAGTAGSCSGNAATASSVGGVSTPAKAAGNAFTFQWDGSQSNINITVDTTFVAYIHQNASDVRIKENIEPIVQDSLSIIDQTEFVSYDYKKGGHINAGVIAQQVEQYAPQWVSEHNNGEFEDARFLKHHEMLMTALHAIQQLSAEVKSLKEQLKGKE